MSKTKKILLGLLTLSPVFFFMWYMLNMFSFAKTITSAIESAEHDVGPPTEVFEMMSSVFLPMMFLVFISFGLLVFYMVHILSINEKFKTTTGNDKVIWIIVVLFTGFVGMTAYFFVEIWPTPMKSDHQEPVQLDI